MTWKLQINDTITAMISSILGSFTVVLFMLIQLVMVGSFSKDGIIRV